MQHLADPADGSPPPYRIQRDGQDMPDDELPMQYAIAQRASSATTSRSSAPTAASLYVQNDVEPLYDTHGEVYGCVSVCVDLTEQKLAERALREADRRKDEFLATLSHELRNPLAPIRTALEVMRLARDEPEVVEKARVTMERQLLQLVRLTDDLLDVSRITQNKLELRRERIDLRDGAAQRGRGGAAGHRRAGARRRTSICRTRRSGSTRDPTRLAQAFGNLLNNAVKYTDRGGRIRITRERQRRRHRPARAGHRHRHPGGHAAAHLRHVHAVPRASRPQRTAASASA